MVPETINPELLRLFPSVKNGSVERGLWRIPLYFDKRFGRNRGCIRLRRYIVHMAEMGESREAMMDKTVEIYDEFAELIKKYSSDIDLMEQRMDYLDKYMIEFIDEVSHLIEEGDSTNLF